MGLLAVADPNPKLSGMPKSRSDKSRGMLLVRPFLDNLRVGGAWTGASPSGLWERAVAGPPTLGRPGNPVVTSVTLACGVRLIDEARCVETR